MNFEIDRDYVIAIRRKLHENPEVGHQEFQTAALIREELTRFGIEYQEVAETGTLGILHGDKPGKTILLKADIDALPITERTKLPFASKNAGVMHACGHDIHTAALLGAAKALSAMKEKLKGKIFFVFELSEEFDHGSQYFLAQGVTKGVDRAYGLHIAPEFPAGTVAYSKGADASSCDYFKITIKGVSAHISKPHLACDALTAAAHLATRLPELTKHINPMNPALVGVGSIHSGSRWNIIPDHAEIEGTIRATSKEDRERLAEELKREADQVAALYQTEAEIYLDSQTAAVVNDDEAYEEACEASIRVLGEENVICGQRLIMGFAGDDFAEYLQDTKGVFAHVGVANDTPESQVPLHSDNLEPDEEAIIVGAKLYAAYVLQVLGN